MVLRLALLSALFTLAAAGQARTNTRNIILVTADGLRWQELFNGVDATLATKYPALIGKKREDLMPFFWGSLVRQGVVLGNPSRNSSVAVTNAFRVSYPGYSEILTGRAQDAAIRGNDKIQNPTETVLEFVRRTLSLPKSKVALFGSWDVFPFIGESKPGSIFINAGYQDDSGSTVMRDLSRLQRDAITPWDSVRHDHITLQMALDYMKREKPRVIHIALGETDDWAHDRRYDRVIWAIQYFDSALKQIADFVNSTSGYKGSTTILVTSDHGRGGTVEDWHGHGAKVMGAEKIWLAVQGPDTPALGEASNTRPAFQRDVAPTILKLLGLDPAEYSGVQGQALTFAN